MTTELNRRATIIECLNNWKISYQVTGNQKVIDNCICELVGENQFTWFQYSETDEFVNINECEELNFDARQELIEFLKIKNNSNPDLNDNWDSIRKRIFNRIAKSFFDKKSEIIGQINGSLKTTQLITFIKKCEHCYFISQNETFIHLAKDVKKVDFQINDWIQAKAYSETANTNNDVIDSISNDFINLLADPKMNIVVPPPPYTIEQKDDKDKHWLKAWYSKYGLWAHSITFVIISCFFFRSFYYEESFWFLETLLFLALVNLLITIYFRFFFREIVQDKNR